MAKAKNNSTKLIVGLVFGTILAVAVGITLYQTNSSKSIGDVRSRASEGSQKCTIKPAPIVLASVDGVNFKIISGRTSTIYDNKKNKTVKKLYIKGINPRTNTGAPNITARMVWNGDAYKGAVCINQVCEVDVPGPNGFPTRFEAFENEVYTNPSIGLDAAQQLYWDESCRTAGGV